MTHGLAVRTALLVRALGVGRFESVTAMSDILILNGRLVDPASGVDAERDLLLRHGKVAAVEKPGGLKDVKAKEVIDAKDWLSRRGSWTCMCICVSRDRPTKSRSKPARLRLRLAGYDSGCDAEYGFR